MGMLEGEMDRVRELERRLNFKDNLISMMVNASGGNIFISRECMNDQTQLVYVTCIPISEGGGFNAHFKDAADEHFRDPADADFAAACREWLKGCTDSSKSNPSECEECTKGFLDAIVSKARKRGVEIGQNSIR